jgi:hypothetical protein
MRVLNYNHNNIMSHSLCCRHRTGVWISVLSFPYPNGLASELRPEPSKVRGNYAGQSCYGNGERVLPMASGIAGYSGPAKSVVFSISCTGSVVVLVEDQSDRRNQCGLDC